MNYLHIYLLSFVPVISAPNACRIVTGSSYPRQKMVMKRFDFKARKKDVSNWLLMNKQLFDSIYLQCVCVSLTAILVFITFFCKCEMLQFTTAVCYCSKFYHVKLHITIRLQTPGATEEKLH